MAKTKPKGSLVRENECCERMGILARDLHDLRIQADCSHDYINVTLYYGGWHGHGKCSSCGKEIKTGGYRYDRVMRKVYALLKRASRQIF